MNLLRNALATLLLFATGAFADGPSATWIMTPDGNGAIPNVGTLAPEGALTLTEGATFSDDPPVHNSGGNALLLDAAAATAAAESAEGWDPLAGAESFTVMVWLRRESASTAVNQSARIFADHDGANGVELRFAGAAGTLVFRVNGTEITAAAAAIPPDNGSWHHVAVVYDATRPATNYATRNVHVYIDGVQKGHGSTLTAVPAANVRPFTVGNSSANRSAANLLAGSIDDVLVFRGWAPAPSGNGNYSPEIGHWLAIDDSTLDPGAHDRDGGTSPVWLDDIVAQAIGAERLHENLKPGTIFLNADTGELCYANEDNPHGRTVCACKGLPDWHSFTNTVRVNGFKVALNTLYSMQAESHVLSFRHGDDAVLQILGDDAGDFSAITAELVGTNQMTVSANAVGTNAVLLVCTNLLATPQFVPATNATVYSSSDAATVWLVNLLDTPAQFYRVQNTITRPSGVYAYKPLRAEAGVVVGEGQGIEMGGETWNGWPDIAGMSNRLAALEYPDTMCLYWPAEYVISNGTAATNYTIVTNEGAVVTNEMVWYTIWVPTNFPTRRLELTIRDKGIPKLNIRFDPKWAPAGPKEININVISSAGEPTNRATRVMLTGTESQYVLLYSKYSEYKDVTLTYDPDNPGYWRTVPRTRAYVSAWFLPSNGGRTYSPTSQPATVEEWIALWDERQSAAPASD